MYFLECIAFKRHMNMKSVISTGSSSYDIYMFTLAKYLATFNTVIHLQMKIHLIQMQIILYIITL